MPLYHIVGTLGRTDFCFFVMDHLHNLRQRYHNLAMPPEAAIENFEIPEKALGELRTWWSQVTSLLG